MKIINPIPPPSISNYVLKNMNQNVDYEIDVNWSSANRQPHFVPTATSNKDRNCNQVTVMNDNESNQNAGSKSSSSNQAAKSNSTENARLQFDNNLSQIFATNMTINDHNRDSNAQRPTELERVPTPRSRSNTYQFESMPNIGENKDCEYLKLVMAFKRTLVLPDVFFSYDSVVCYCTVCLCNSGRSPFEGICWFCFVLLCFGITLSLLLLLMPIIFGL